ncbi:Microtubule-associated protein mu-2, partial [Frankliniella fusca]
VPFADNNGTIHQNDLESPVSCTLKEIGPLMQKFRSQPEGQPAVEHKIRKKLTILPKPNSQSADELNFDEQSYALCQGPIEEQNHCHNEEIQSVDSSNVDGGVVSPRGP